jgi:selenide,water dikinase
MEKIRLTQYAKGAGCGCKIAPAVLEQMLGNGMTVPDQQLLVGNNTKDDAAVYDLGNGNALVLTADFFMPIVDDAFQFGSIAAANAISDIYAMGARPVTAIALLGWPIDKLPAEVASQVLNGAKEVCKKAGIMISGGHTIESPEPFFGLSVNGLCEVQHIKRNSTARAGDILLLSKPIGVGILATAQKRGVLSSDEEEVMLQQMTTLNTFGQVLGAVSSVSAMTDVTGFGLLGHLLEMAEGAELSAILQFNRVPVIEASKKHALNHIVPDATYRNWNAYSNKVSIAPEVDPFLSFTLLPDPQTNGGLLLAVAPDSVEYIVSLAKQHGVTLTEIGYFEEQKEKMVKVI